MAGRDAFHQLINAPDDKAKWKHQADARTTLRTVVVYGLDDRLSLPDDEELLWDGDLRWRHSDGHEPGCQEFDWVIDYLELSAPTKPVEAANNGTKNDSPTETADDETDGDALLALGAMRGLGSTAKRPSYITSLIRCMGPARPPRVRHAALRAVSEARGELASITRDSMPQGVDVNLLDTLSRAILTVVCPNRDQTDHGSGPDAIFHKNRNLCYFRLISALTKSDEWCQRLIRDGHLEWCISLVDKVSWIDNGYHLLVIFGRIGPFAKDHPFSTAQHTWQGRIDNTWFWASRSYSEMDDEYVDAIPALVIVTRLNFLGSDNSVSSWTLGRLADNVHGALAKLQEGEATNSIAHATVVTAISSVQGLYDDLRREIDDRNASERDNRALGS
ncbi:uncharacterized protein EDB91DRAFT_1170624 [Suillus paluster]|uniref:uncharacterized protein n=1 Tax=Suillus paluster TaxID=48578 RepID=UPI001B8867CC|nr:uncharacterized protein EDB91DRAFT_1170624 [Suillus paluster]KAG1724653.1 hypothetical protein EDB91DRAFT_1170624 [Suillus paluster]